MTNLQAYIIIVPFVLFQPFQEYKSSFELGDTKLGSIDNMEMVFVPEGSFRMGSSDMQIDKAMEECRRMYHKERDCQRHIYSNQEQPQHEVFVDAFWIDKTEVTNAQFCIFLKENSNRSTNGIKWLKPVAEILAYLR